MSVPGFVKFRDNSLMWQAQRLSRSGSAVYADAQTLSQTTRLLCWSLWHILDTDSSGSIDGTQVEMLRKLVRIATGTDETVSRQSRDFHEENSSALADLLSSTKRVNLRIQFEDYLKTVTNEAESSRYHRLAMYTQIWCPCALPTLTANVEHGHVMQICKLFFFF
jgi:hypothetical protein